jgi:branched-chain amino acid transport system permease protein
MLPQILVNSAAAGSVYALVALGFGIIYTSTRVFHFAHASVFTASAYTMYMAVVLFRFPVLPSLALTVCLAALLGMALEQLIYAPLVTKGASGGVILVTSLGANAALINLIAAVFGNEGKVLFPGQGKTFHLAVLTVTAVQAAEIGIFAIVCVVTLVFIRRSTAGRLLQALADSPALLSVIGFDSRRVRLAAFAVGSALAGTAAALVALDVGMDPYGGLNMLLASAVAVIVGGLTKFHGALVGAFILALLQQFSVSFISTTWEQPITFLLLIVFLLFRPIGILGRTRRAEEL